MKKPYLDAYELDDDPGRLQYQVLEKWLSVAYWSPGIRVPEIRKAAENSTLVAGCYAGPVQVGYMRLVSDRTRFAYIMDVYVDEAHRGRGIGENLVRFATEHPDLADVYQWVLATKDAHDVYRKAGFEPLPAPDRWMIFRKEKVRP